MTRTTIVTLLVALTAIPLAAQRPVVPTEPDSHRFRIWLDGREVTERLQPLVLRRARLGIGVRLTAAATDSVGAYVDAVTPGGPAARSGLRTGDIIVALKGQSVLRAEGREIQHDESLPGIRLIELAAKLEPDETITVEFQRDGGRRTVSLVTGDEPIEVFGGELQMRFPGLTIERMPRGLDTLSETRFGILRGRLDRDAGTMVFLRSPLNDLELAPLNEDLGSYFGTTVGILVIRAPTGTGLGLKGGDVIQRIDGRTPGTPAGLLRILRSYEPNESFRMEILRQRQRETITGQIPGRGGR